MASHSFHRDTLTSVKWQRQISPTYVEKQEVRQGGVLSTDLFKVYNTDHYIELTSLERVLRLGIMAYKFLHVLTI